MTHYFIIPGLGNSGEKHWQTYFENSGDNFYRINQKDWEAPHCGDWIATVDAALEGYDLSNVVLIGHSLGCSTIAHWANRYGKRVKGALLVAPSDMEAPLYQFPISGFTPMPLQRLPFKTIVVASTNDPWVTMERAAFFADSWGSLLVSIGDAGHINADSNLDAWEEGRAFLSQLD
ncbi:MAG: serine hydrolase family protein [Filimonas sp.]|nr:serine hydrolase family protein [Filimonas sp.]